MLKLKDNREIIYVEALQPQKKKLRVAAYARVSRDTTEQKNSFLAQVNYYTKLIQDNEEWELVDVYSDEGITGVSREKRDDFNRMVSDCEKGRIDRVITKSISRFSRNNYDAIDVARKLKEIGVSVYFESERLDTSKMASEMLFSIRATFAQRESMNISENVKKGKRHSMMQGEFALSNPPYGYRLINKVLVPYEPETKIVKQIFNNYIMGKGCLAIAKELNDQKIPRKDGKLDWGKKAIAFMIKNEKYKGDSLYQKSFNEDEIPYKQHRNKGELDMYYAADTHEGIIEKEIFILANQLLKDKSDGVSEDEYINYILSRKITCMHCGTTYRRKISNNSVYWVCRKYDDDKTSCKSQWVLERDIYDAFIIMYNNLKSDNNKILNVMCKRLEYAKEMKNDSNLELKDINKQIAELNRQNQVLSDLMNDDILDSVIFISQSDDINRQLHDLKKQKKNITDKQDDNTLLENTEILMNIIKTGPEKLQNMDEQIFNDIVNKIKIVDRKTIIFEVINGLKIKARLYSSGEE